MLERLAVLRVLRRDRLRAAALTLVEDELGPEFAEPGIFDLRNSYTKKTMRTGDVVYGQVGDEYDSFALDYVTGTVIVDAAHTTRNVHTGADVPTPRFFTLFSNVKKNYIC